MRIAVISTPEDFDKYVQSANLTFHIRFYHVNRLGYVMAPTFDYFVKLGNDPILEEIRQEWLNFYKIEETGTWA